MKRQNQKPKQGYHISNIEWMIIAGFAVFGIVWTLFIIPILTGSNWFSRLNPPAQYLVYNIGSVILLTVILGIPLDYFFEGEVSIKGILLSGVMSFTLFAILDLWQPPFAYGWSGTLLITNPDALPSAAIDRVLGWVWTGAGIKGHALYLSIYIVSPVIAIIGNAILLKPDQLLKLIER